MKEIEEEKAYATNEGEKVTNFPLFVFVLQFL
jgi:hypothetical protein